MTCLSCVILCAGCYPAQRKALIAFTEGSVGDDAFPRGGRGTGGRPRGRAVATQAPSVKAVHRAITDENILPDLESQFVLD
jgi:hypothetical protein